MFLDIVGAEGTGGKLASALQFMHPLILAPLGIAWLTWGFHNTKIRKPLGIFLVLTAIGISSMVLLNPGLATLSLYTAHSFRILASFLAVIFIFIVSRRKSFETSNRTVAVIVFSPCPSSKMLIFYQLNFIFPYDKNCEGNTLYDEDKDLSTTYQIVGAQEREREREHARATFSPSIPDEA